MKEFQYIITLTDEKDYSDEERHKIMHQLKARMEGYYTKIDFGGEMIINIVNSGEILVQDKVLKVADIVDIFDAEAHKEMFLNREAGFVVVMKDGSQFKFSQNIPYDSYPHEISEYKTKWKKLMDSVVREWRDANFKIPTFKV